MAGFNTAVTGLKAASTMLDVTGNNIANSSTVGFKGSRTEFADIYASSVVGAGSSNIAGSGVTVSDIAQDFSAGTVEFTNNNLDLAINGQGFFQLNDGRGGITYTRAGAFQLDKEGAIVSKTGSYLQGIGLDEAGDRTTLGNMAVSATTNPPKPTEVMELSVNIDAALDPTELLSTFDRTEPSSYSYSTTVEAVNNLGESLSTRYYFVEQKPSRDVYTYNVEGVTPGANNDVVSISGVDYYIPTSAVGIPTALTPVDTSVSLASEDPRIDTSTIFWTATNAGTGADDATGVLSFEIYSEYSSYGDVVVNSTDVTVSVDASAAATRPANELQVFDFITDVFSGATSLDAGFSLSLAGVNINISPPSSTLSTEAERINYVGNAIESYEPAILENNPDLESVKFVFDQTVTPYEPQIQVTWKASVGNVSDTAATFTGNDAAAVFTDPTQPTVQYQGDPSYQGAYRLYGFLENDGVITQLNLGKSQDPGEGELTEEGPVMVKFDPSNGLLSKINQIDVTNISDVPKIDIQDWDILEPSNVISLDLTGSTQFSSTSIVKAASQDGYPAGDLIGVSFGPSGEVVASYSNGQQQNLGVVQIATFANQAGLQSVGDTEWAASLLSGSAVLNDPGAGLGGTLSQAALEQSNVDLSAELVNLIKAQRNFQANSKTLETMNTVTQAILQI